jgi:hypothetical protein
MQSERLDMGKQLFDRHQCAADHIGVHFSLIEIRHLRVLWQAVQFPVLSWKGEVDG